MFLLPRAFTNAQCPLWGVALSSLSLPMASRNKWWFQVEVNLTLTYFNMWLLKKILTNICWNIVTITYLLQYKFNLNSGPSSPPWVNMGRTEYLIYTSLSPCFLWSFNLWMGLLYTMCNGFIIPMNRKGWRGGILEAEVNNILYCCVLI